MEKSEGSGHYGPSNKRRSIADSSRGHNAIFFAGDTSIV